MRTLPVELLRMLFVYDEVEGRLFRTAFLSEVPVLGIPHVNGYTYLRIDGVNYCAHRVVWAIHFGAWPRLEIDHIDGDKRNNRILNLRLATRSQNMQNRRKANVNSKTGVLGVSRKAGKFVARIATKDGVCHHLGYFVDLEAAKEAYLAAKRELHPFCTI